MSKYTQTCSRCHSIIYLFDPPEAHDTLEECIEALAERVRDLEATP